MSVMKKSDLSTKRGEGVCREGGGVVLLEGEKDKKKTRTAD